MEKTIERLSDEMVVSEFNRLKKTKLSFIGREYESGDIGDCPKTMLEVLNTRNEIRGYIIYWDEGGGKVIAELHDKLYTSYTTENVLTGRDETELEEEETEGWENWSVNKGRTVKFKFPR